MPRIQKVLPEQASDKVATQLEAIKAKRGMVPNMFGTLAHAPAVLDGYLAFSEALSKGRLTAVQREVIALALAQHNQCGYCLAAHTAIAKRIGMDEAAILQARGGSSPNETDSAITGLTIALLEHGGELSTDRLEALRDMGIDDGLVLEVIANVAMNIFTNYTNSVAQTDVDFPPVTLAL
ncbi:carboxymuconolactone decarboxylase family protein [Pseudoduganella plicata]|uniref:Alkyl hydroperoxide reductase AhpD n=1 Tax=Pseudoduganella plicata TaxID=321984 RepID=A0A4P7BGX6_9BURK|nr:carboxymuconolactone decarboxylase family protein [Pseudoduganella plicata]QBQ37512.1 carboxymuconolactone decarboxylase family protein [Pseudoduganella plicata]GGY90819.1 alkyl hydroperoxide reductase AhpD [Pseudoduganella plicata]